MHLQMITGQPRPHSESDDFVASGNSGCGNAFEPSGVCTNFVNL